MLCRHFAALLPFLAAAFQPSVAAVSIGVGVNVPGVQIGVDMPAYPELQPIPGYPVYYAPAMPLNYFFYDGLYWVFDNDTWYSGAWYDGPWMAVGPEAVPAFILRVPVRYYQRPPLYFLRWPADASPHWAERWGPRWAESRRDWDQWDRRAAPPPAPLPVYQREYSGSRYPGREQQEAIRQQHYRFRPHDPQVQRVDAEVQQAKMQSNADPGVEAPPRQPLAVNRPAPAQPQPMPSPRRAQSIQPDIGEADRTRPPTAQRPRPAEPAAAQRHAHEAAGPAESRERRD